MTNAAGYSGTPLPKKLGIATGQRVLVHGAPASFTLGDLDALGLHDVAVVRRLGPGPYDVVLSFASGQRSLARTFPTLRGRIGTNGGLWIAWPKRSSGVTTDLDENFIRQVGLDAGLVDNKVCAIDDTWSGLRFVVRLRDR